VNLSDTALVLELAPFGVLGEMLHNSATDMAKPLKKKMSLEIIKGLQYLHTREPPIIHRDLRSYNVFVISMDTEADVSVKIGMDKVCFLYLFCFVCVLLCFDRCCLLFLFLQSGDFGLSTLTYIPTNEPLESWQWIAPEVCLFFVNFEFDDEDVIESFISIWWFQFQFQVFFSSGFGIWFRFVNMINTLSLHAVSLMP
jgi:serine/threonine protein kinase